MSNWIIRQRIDLDSGYMEPRILPTALMMQGDKKAHEWRISVYQGGQPVQLAGTVQGSFQRQGDSAESYVPVTGSISGNVAKVRLVSECYAKPGTLLCVMRLLSADTTENVTLGMMAATVEKQPSGAVVDPEHIIPDLATLLAQIEACETATSSANTAAGAANTAAGAANTAKSAANSAASRANTAAASAEDAASDAILAAGEADDATDAANAAAAAANAAAATADTAADDANNAASAANAAAEDATEATGTANTAAQAADAAREEVVANETTRQANEQTRQDNETGRESAEAARETKLNNLNFGITMIAPSGTPAAHVTQDADSIDVELDIPTSNLAYATFGIDTEGDLYMYSPEGFDDINFQITADGELAVVIGQ